MPMDSVVAQINIDDRPWACRGFAGWRSDYVGVVGLFFDSKDLGDEWRQSTRRRRSRSPSTTRYDTTLTWTGYNNITAAAITSLREAGRADCLLLHAACRHYHQLSDEAEFIDYPHYARITNYLKDLLVRWRMDRGRG